MSAPVGDTPGQLLPGLQYYRAFAAAIVVLFHAAGVFGLAGLIAVVLLADPRSRLTGRSHRLLAFLGNASYAIYLWHLLPQRVIAHELGRFGLVSVTTRPVAILLLALSGLAIGAIVYQFVERPLLRWLNTVFLPRRANSSDPGTDAR